MNIVIVGNAKTNGEKIKEIATALIEAGINVRYPSMDDIDAGGDFPIIETFERIDWANFVIAVPKEGLTFGPTITAEMAYAKHAKKSVFIYYDY